MGSMNAMMLLAGILLLLGIASSKFSARLGMPMLVLFLAVGMLAGSEGLGGIPFEDYSLANSVGSVALVLILFDGGLRTSLASLRLAWRPALSLATVGVLLTSVLTGLAAMWILDVPLLYGMLLGGIISSTDAAAVFSILRTSGVKLPERLAATLEVESGSNDPMAIFLTLGLVGIITGTASSAAALFLLFLLQFGVGAAVGIGMGRVAAWAINYMNLDYPGLYPLLALAFSLLVFGLAAVLGGSGFLAVYLAGIVLGNSPIVFRRGIRFFHDAAAWLGQIVLFVMLGLLSFPSRLLAVAGSGLLIALVLILVARPLAVTISVFPFGFRLRELAFISWVGLKGAVPITLATFPLMAGIPGSEALFNVVFFVVLVSAITQGWSLTLVARWLKLARPADPAPPVSVEINALRHVDGEIVEYTVAPTARVAGQPLRNLALPDEVVVTLIVRGEKVIIPRGATVLQPGDHVFVAMRTRIKPLMDQLFDPEAGALSFAPDLQLSFHAESTVGQICRFFGLPCPMESTVPVGSLLPPDGTGRRARLGPFLIAPGDEPDRVTLIYAPDAETVGAGNSHSPALPEDIGATLR